MRYHTPLEQQVVNKVSVCIVFDISTGDSRVSISEWSGDNYDVTMWIPSKFDTVKEENMAHYRF